MSCVEIEWGKCEICGKEATLRRKYFHYPIKCECHAPQHFEIVRHCANCEPKEPLETKIRLKTDALKKLAQYEDLEEQGLLVRLPCKVGDTVYYKGDEYKIYYLVYCSKTTTETPAIKFFAECMYNADCDDIDFWNYEIGKNVFLTREEAEAALRKMGGDGE